jgi:hypothetical protein
MYTIRGEYASKSREKEEAYLRSEGTLVGAAFTGLVAWGHGRLVGECVCRARSGRPLHHVGGTRLGPKWSRGAGSG